MQQESSRKEPKYERITGNSLQALLLQMRTGKKKDDKTEPKISPTLVIQQVSELQALLPARPKSSNARSSVVQVGQTYLVVRNFKTFLNEYSKTPLIITNDLVHMFGQKVVVQKIDEFSLCRVEFVAADLEPGFLPISVLRDVNDFSPVKCPPTPIKPETKSEPIATLVSFENRIKKLKDEEEKQAKKWRNIVKDLKSDVANLHDGNLILKTFLQNAHANENTLARKLEKCIYENKKMKQFNELLLRDIEKYKEDFILCDIKNIDRLIEKSCIGDLSNAQNRISDRINVLHEIEMKQANDSVVCKICLSEKKTRIFLPCFHAVCCDLCVKELSKRDPNYKCPICRTKVESARKFFA